MANYDFTLKDERKFPNGASASLYAVSNWPTPEAQRNPSGAPVGSRTGSAQTVTSGSATFAATPEGDYWAYASVNGVDVYERVSVTSPLSGPFIPTGALSADGTFASPNDQTVPSSLAAKTYADTKTAKATLAAKGSIYAASAASTPAELAVGTDGKALLADSAAAKGLSYNTLFQTGTHAARLAQAHKAGILFKETDTNLIYLDDGTNWIIWKGDGYVAKTADETVNNSAVLQNDDHLFFPIEVNESWFFEALLLCTGASATADWLYGFTGPTGATGSWAVGAAQGSWNTATTGGTPAAARTIAQNTAIGGISGQILVSVSGWFFAASTAGTINFQWAQNTATVENSVINKGSWARLRRLS